MPGKVGIRFPKIADLSRCRLARRPHWNLRTSFSSCPVCLARAPANLQTTLIASSPQPPRDSTTTGSRVIPCLLQASPAPRQSEHGQNQFLGAAKLSAIEPLLRVSVEGEKGGTPGDQGGHQVHCLTRHQSP